MSQNTRQSGQNDTTERKCPLPRCKETLGENEFVCRFCFRALSPPLKRKLRFATYRSNTWEKVVLEAITYLVHNRRKLFPQRYANERK